MKIFAIKSDSLSPEKELGFLYYYEKSKTFYIELPSDADPWETPMPLDVFVKNNIFTVNSYYSMLWVRQRIVPTDRQNLGYILKANKMSEYDEFKLLVLNDGRCEQDDYYLTEVTKANLPEEIKKREMKHIEFAINIDANQIFVEFVNNTVAVCRISAYADKLKSLASWHDETDNDTVSPGGFYYITNEKQEIPAQWIYDNSTVLPISAESLNKAVPKMLYSTSELRNSLSCTRQNIDDMVKRNRLTPIEKDAKSKLFLCSEVNKIKWQ